MDGFIFNQQKTHFTKLEKDKLNALLRFSKPDTQNRSRWWEDGFGLLFCVVYFFFSYLIWGQFDGGIWKKEE